MLWFTYELEEKTSTMLKPLEVFLHITKIWQNLKFLTDHFIKHKPLFSEEWL